MFGTISVEIYIGISGNIFVATVRICARTFREIHRGALESFPKEALQDIRRNFK